MVKQIFFLISRFGYIMGERFIFIGYTDITTVQFVNRIFIQTEDETAPTQRIYSSQRLISGRREIQLQEAHTRYQLSYTLPF